MDEAGVSNTISSPGTATTGIVENDGSCIPLRKLGSFDIPAIFTRFLYSAVQISTRVSLYYFGMHSGPGSRQKGKERKKECLPIRSRVGQPSSLHLLCYLSFLHSCEHKQMSQRTRYLGIPIHVTLCLLKQCSAPNPNSVTQKFET
jgi:hypothetical protein